MTNEQRQRIENAKNETPTTSLFLWFIPVFLIIAIFTRSHIEIKNGDIVFMQERF